MSRRRAGTNRQVGTSRRDARRGGFTVLELVVTLGLVALLAVLARPTNAVDRAHADAAAHRVRSAVDHARRMAVARRHNVLVSFDTVRHRIRIVEDRNNDKSLSSGERVTWRPLEEANAFSRPPLRLGGTAARGAIWGSTLFDRDGFPSVVFNGSGSPSSGLEIYLRSRHEGRESRRAVAVSAATGHSDWYTYVAPTAWVHGAKRS